MKANPSPMSVADYCQDFISNKIVVNTEYQRKEGLWNNSARSFFIESILLEYPIPKLFLYAKLDLKTRTTIKEIVDGQQRSQALVAFFNNSLALSSNIENEDLRGLKYNALPDEWKTKFLGYSLPIDQFSGVPEDEVREAFRRMNANNVPLNAEEQRNALYQGPFKWFIVSLAESFKDVLFNVGLLSKRDLIRMADLKLYAEIALTLDSGFQTVKAAQIDKIYKKYNTSFEHEDDFRSKIAYGLNFFIDHTELHQTAFLRMHIFQSIVLAALAKQYGGQYLDDTLTSRSQLITRLDQAQTSLEVLSNSIQEPELFPQLIEFTAASTRATNTAESRLIRFIYFWATLSKMF